MHEETDSLSENESKNSELSHSETSHGQELIVSEAKLTGDNADEDDQNVYERKLDEKLKDLGLYEDDMTIQQKEELLAVVVVSCETAEQEESRRQLVQDYLDGSNDFSGEGIEFSFQESGWLADEANLLCSSTVSKGNTLSAETSMIKENTTKYSPGLFEDEITVVQNPFESQSSSSSRCKGKRRPPRRGRLRRRSTIRPSTISEIKVAVTHPLSHEECELDIIDKQIHLQRQKLLLEKSLSVWKPCMSPKDEPLLHSRRKEQSDKDTPFVCSEQKCGQKFFESFENFASSLAEDRTCKISPMDKPYLLLHRGSYAKKSVKLDKFDHMVGVSDESFAADRTEIGIISALEQCDSFTRTNSAFHHVKPNACSKLYSYSDEMKDAKDSKLSHFSNSFKTTRSGAKYGSQKLSDNSLELENCESPSEMILSDSFSQLHSNMNDENLSLEPVDFHSSEHYTIASDEKLPEFSNLRPDISFGGYTYSDNQCLKDGILPVDHHHPLKYNNDMNFHSSSKVSERKEHLANLSQRDSDSSNSSSSLIDVETIVDDEIEDFVLKRKTLPDHSMGKFKDSNHAKRMKENAL